jgi:hypothetical protein
MTASGGGFRCLWVTTDKFAKGRAVVVEAFCGFVEDEFDALAVVAIETGVVQEVRELRSGCCWDT